MVVLNKWDVLNADDREETLADMADRLAFLSYAPVLKTSALTGPQRRPAAAGLVPGPGGVPPAGADPGAQRSAAGRPAAHPPPVDRGQRPRVLYATQGATDPPTFTLFTTRELPAGYLRYLERKIREAFSIGPTPIKLRVRRRSSTVGS